MSEAPFLTREVRNFKSIALCDVRLAPLNFLVGPNVSGKSNFVDALRLVRDCMTGTLSQAMDQQRGHRFGKALRRWRLVSRYRTNGFE